MNRTDLFVLKRGKLLRDVINNDSKLNLVRGNETEELALHHLYTNPKARMFFEKLPEEGTLTEMLAVYAETYEAARGEKNGKGTGDAAADKILNDAHEGADAIIADAKLKASQIIKDAELKASETIAGLELVATNLVVEAEDKASQIIKDAELKASETIAGLELVATNLVVEAEDKAAEIIKDAESKAEAEPKDVAPVKVESKTTKKPGHADDPILD